MRSSWRTIGLAGVLLLTSGAARAQQQPTYGCHASVNCQPLGFSTIRSDGTYGLGGGALFGVGFKWDPGFVFYIAGPQDILFAPKPTPAFEGQLFHLNVSMLAPPTIPAPGVTPTPTPQAGPRNPTPRD